jgi:hypothetical protein
VGPKSRASGSQTPQPTAHNMVGHVPAQDCGFRVGF